MGGKSSSSASSTATTQQDNRVVTERGNVAGTGATATQTNDSSLHLSDSSTTNITNADSARIVELTSQLQGALGESQADAVKAIAQLGSDTIKTLGESVTNLYGQAGANTATAYETAIKTAQPSDARIADSFKYAAIAAAAIAALMVFKKA